MLLRSRGFSPRAVVAPQGSLTSKGGATAGAAENEAVIASESSWITLIGRGFGMSREGWTDGLSGWTDARGRCVSVREKRLGD